MKWTMTSRHSKQTSVQFSRQMLLSQARHSLPPPSLHIIYFSYLDVVCIYKREHKKHMHTTTIEETNVHILRKLRLAGDTRRGMVSVCAFEPCPKNPALCASWWSRNFWNVCLNVLSRCLLQWSRDVPAFLGTSQATGMYYFMVRIKARDKVSPLIAKTKKKWRISCHLMLPLPRALRLMD